MKVLLALILAFATAAPPNVARIDVQDRNSKSLGTGTLIESTLVITNWHVVKDRAGQIQVIFPDLTCNAQVIKTDKTWDLAALRIEPVALPLVELGEGPQLGETVTVGGYGSGEYRSEVGNVIGYYSPLENTPHDFFRVNARTRDGDSGGPILKDGKLVGVLFGGGAAGTYGVNVKQVRIFLEDITDAEESYNLWGRL